MTTRPMRPDEAAYLERYRETLKGTLSGAAIAVGFLALPLGFLTLSWASNGRSELGSLVLAGVILLGLIAGVIGFSGRGWAPLVNAWTALMEWRGLREDFEAQQVTVEAVRIDAKNSPKAASGKGRVYELRAGRRRFRVSARTYLGVAPGTSLTFEYASHSRVLLAVDGEPERLPLTARAAAEEALAEEL